MNLRNNARLTPQGRLLMVCRIEEQGWKVTDAALAAGLSVRRTYHGVGRLWCGGCGGRRSLKHRARTARERR